MTLINNAASHAALTVMPHALLSRLMVSQFPKCCNINKIIHFLFTRSGLLKRPQLQCQD